MQLNSAFRSLRRQIGQIGSGMRVAIAALSLSAGGLVGIAVHEGYSSNAYPDPVHGAKVPTIGFGTTGGVKMGDTTTPVQALQRKLSDVQAMEGAVKRCVAVPLHQHEYDAFLDFSYNIGTAKFCGSTLVKKLNAGDYEGACREMARWTYAGPFNCALPQYRSKCGGLVTRREQSVAKCLGQQP
jgi:lysozyme